MNRFRPWLGVSRKELEEYCGDGDAEQKELAVELSDRMTLNPYAAKRLAILLSNTINEYEKLFGTLELNIPEAKKE